jgi:hypothetical protein
MNKTKPETVSHDTFGWRFRRTMAITIPANKNSSIGQRLPNRK